MSIFTIHDFSSYNIVTLREDGTSKITLSRETAAKLANARIAPLVAALEKLREADKGGPFVFAFAGESVLAAYEALKGKS